MEYHQACNHPLLSEIKNNRLAHAYLFSGPKETNQVITAKNFIKAIIKADSVAAKRIDEDDFLDLLYITKQQKNEITIDAIRAAQDFFYQTSAEGKHKFVIIDLVEDLNVNAANALLKILEEPSQNTHLFLISNGFYKVLPTIRSRCRIIRFNPVNDKFENNELYDQIKQLILEFNIIAFNKFADNLGKKSSQQWNDIKDLILVILSEFIKKSAAAKLDSWFNIYDDLNKLFTCEAIYNLDRKQVLLISIQSIKEKL